MKQGRHPPTSRLRYQINDNQAPVLRERLGRDLARMLTWQFPLLGQGCRDLEGIVIHFVTEEELEPYISQSPPAPDLEPSVFDVLGVYLDGTSSPGECSSAAKILISPDKILRAAQGLHTSAALDMPVEQIHRVLLASVAIHELAHAMMDGHTRPLRAASHEWFDPYTSRYGFIFEESLAEACVLAQHVKDDERHVIETFMESAPSAYQAGKYWHALASSAPCKLIWTMRAWRDHKALDTGLLTRLPELRKHLHALQSTANKLLHGSAPALPFDFRAALITDLKHALDSGLVNDDRLVQHHLDYRNAAEVNVAELQALRCAQCDDVREDEASVRTWLEQHGITKFEIEGGMVHVNGDVDISGQDLACIPVRFGRVNGHFDCSGNRLRSLCALPSVVIGNVYCCDNEVSSLGGLSGHGRIIAGYLCLDGSKDEFLNLLQAVEVKGLQLITALDKGINIVNGFLGRPDDIFECQAELIENGFEHLAHNNPHCERCPQAASSL